MIVNAFSARLNTRVGHDSLFRQAVIFSIDCPYGLEIVTAEAPRHTPQYDVDITDCINYQLNIFVFKNLTYIQGVILILNYPNKKYIFLKNNKIFLLVVTINRLLDSIRFIPRKTGKE